jgi:putative redox protein
MNSKVTWKSNLAFDGTAGSGLTVPLDGSPAAGGEGKGFLPLELLAMGLAGCTAMDVISILQKMQQQVSAFEVNVKTERASEHPKVFTNIAIEYVVTGKNIDRSSVEKAVNLSETRYCAAEAMLRKAVPIQSEIKIIEA